MHQLEVIQIGELSQGRILEWRDVGQEALDAVTKKSQKEKKSSFYFPQPKSITFPSIIVENFFFPPKKHTCQPFCNESFTSFMALTIVCYPFPEKDSIHCGLGLFLLTLIFFSPNTLVQLDLQIFLSHVEFNPPLSFQQTLSFRLSLDFQPRTFFFPLQTLDMSSQ